MLINKFFNIKRSFKKMKENSKKISILSMEEISLMTGPCNHYYESRAKEGFTFDDQLKEVDPSSNDLL